MAPIRRVLPKFHRGHSLGPPVSVRLSQLTSVNADKQFEMFDWCSRPGRRRPTRDKLPKVLCQEHLSFLDFDNVELNAMAMERLHQCSPNSTEPNQKCRERSMKNLVLGRQKEFLHEIHEVVNRHSSGAG